MLWTEGVTCWFIHDDESKNDKINYKNDNQTNELTEKVMNMMEKITKRIIELENKLQAMKTME